MDDLNLGQLETDGYTIVSGFLDRSMTRRVREHMDSLLPPMALHSGSSNAKDQPRYVHFASFFDTSATYLWDELRRTKYRDGFPDSLRENLPKDLLPLLAW